MRLIRTTLPAVAATAAVGALVAGVVVSTIEARHHKPSHRHSTSLGQTISQDARQSAAQALGAMSLPKGITHTQVCPGYALTTDACFAGTLTAPVSSPADATDVATTMVKSLGVTPGPISCQEVIGGPQGTGYGCTGVGTWHTVSVGVSVFVSNAGHHPAGIPGLDAMLSVLPTRS